MGWTVCRQQNDVTQPDRQDDRMDCLPFICNIYPLLALLGLHPMPYSPRRLRYRKLYVPLRWGLVKLYVSLSLGFVKLYVLQKRNFFPQERGFVKLYIPQERRALSSRNGDVVMLYSLQKWSFSQQKHCVPMTPIVHKTKHSGVYLYRLPSPVISIHTESSEYVYRPTDSLSTETKLLSSVSYHRHHYSLAPPLCLTLRMKQRKVCFAYTTRHSRNLCFVFHLEK